MAAEQTMQSAAEMRPVNWLEVPDAHAVQSSIEVPPSQGLKVPAEQAVQAA